MLASAPSWCKCSLGGVPSAARRRAALTQAGWGRMLLHVHIASTCQVGHITASRPCPPSPCATGIAVCCKMHSRSLLGRLHLYGRLRYSHPIKCWTATSSPVLPCTSPACRIGIWCTSVAGATVQGGGQCCRMYMLTDQPGLPANTDVMQRGCMHQLQACMSAAAVLQKAERVQCLQISISAGLAHCISEAWFKQSRTPLRRGHATCIFLSHNLW